MATLNEGDVKEEVMPLTVLLERANRLKPMEIVELVTTFLPAPGIDIMKEKGFLAWSKQDDHGVVRTYFSKPGSV